MRALVGRKVEIHQLAAKSARLPGAKGDAHGHPDEADDLGGEAEVDPQKEADREAGQRRQRVADGVLPSTNEVVDEGSQVHAHECDERAEVEKLRAQIVAAKALEDDGADEREEAHHPDVVARHATLGIDIAEEAAWQRAAASHAVE